MQNNKRVAIIGSGISGLSLGYFLNKHADIILFEKEQRIGGHARTIKVNNGKKEVPVDTGFIVFNYKNYPLLTLLFDHLKIKTQKTHMSFSVSLENGEHEWSANSLDAFFAQRSNILKPRVWRGVYDILRFNKSALKMVENNPSMSLRHLLNAMRLGDWFCSTYILPMGGAIWSISPAQLLDFPAKTFLTFFHNHGLLSLTNHLQWYTVCGGSVEYVKKISEPFHDHIVFGEGIVKVTRTSNLIYIETSQGRVYEFDHVVFACHSYQVLKILKDPSDKERQALMSIPYQKNEAYLHQDISFMPNLRKCWSSWNVFTHGKGSQNSISLTYWMNRLQNIDENFPLFLTLNPPTEIRQECTLDRYEFSHPVFGFGSDEGKSLFKDLQGENNTWYCGAYLGDGFHEDGVRSAYEVVQKMGFPLPW